MSGPKQRGGGGVEDYLAKRRLIDILNDRLACENPQDTLRARELLSQIAEDLTRLNLMLTERRR